MGHRPMVQSNKIPSANGAIHLPPLGNKTMRYPNIFVSPPTSILVYFEYFVVKSFFLLPLTKSLRLKNIFKNLLYYQNV